MISNGVIYYWQAYELEKAKALKVSQSVSESVRLQHVELASQLKTRVFQYFCVSQFIYNSQSMAHNCQIVNLQSLLKLDNLTTVTEYRQQGVQTLSCSVHYSQE